MKIKNKNVLNVNPKRSINLQFFVIFPIQIRGVEIGIVLIVLMVWAGAIALFFNRWGKIRMLLPYQPDYNHSSIKFTPMSKILLQNLDPCSLCPSSFLVVALFVWSLFISQFVFNFCVTFLSIFVVLHTSDCQSLWWAVGGGFPGFCLPAVFRVNCAGE